MNDYQLAERYKKAIESEIHVKASIEGDGLIVPFTIPKDLDLLVGLEEEHSHMSIVYPHLAFREEVDGDDDLLNKMINSLNIAVFGIKFIMVDFEDGRVIATMQRIIAETGQEPSQEYLNAHIGEYVDEMILGLKESAKVKSKFFEVLEQNR
jgi:hypothetical protein